MRSGACRLLMMHYDILGVPTDATPQDIEMAFRVLSWQYTREANGGDASALHKLEEARSAFKVLGNSEYRQAYDEKLKRAERSKADESVRRKVVELSSKNYYELLQVDAAADARLIGAAYESLRGKLERAIEEGDIHGAVALKLVNRAYEVLSDAKRRDAYDETLKNAMAQLSARAAASPPMEPDKTTTTANPGTGLADVALGLAGNGSAAAAMQSADRTGPIYAGSASFRLAGVNGWLAAAAQALLLWALAGIMARVAAGLLKSTASGTGIAILAAVICVGAAAAICYATGRILSSAWPLRGPAWFRLLGIESRGRGEPRAWHTAVLVAMAIAGLLLNAATLAMGR